MSKRTRKIKMRRFHEEMVIRVAMPTRPLLLGTGLTVLNAQTSAHTAANWRLELEHLYINHYGKGCLGWNADHMHPVDRAAMELLNAVDDQAAWDELDGNVQRLLANEDWRRNYPA